MQSILQAPLGQRNRVILVVFSLILVLGFLYLARGALTPFVLGLAFGYLVLPIVRWIERWLPTPEGERERTRLLAVVVVYLFVFILVLLVAAFVFPVVFRQVSRFFELLPATVARAQEVLADWTAQYRASVPPEFQSRIDDAFAQIVQNLGQTAQEAAVRIFTVVSQTFSVLLGLATIPVWLFYVLKDEQKAKVWLNQLVPPAARHDVGTILGIMDRVLSSYLRAQLLLGLIVGVLMTIGLTALGVPFALVLGIIAGVMELIPILGPILGSIPAILVTLANSPQQVLFVVLLSVGVQQLENNLLVPRIQGRAVELHPAVIMVLLILASEVAGLWGMLVVVPLTAVCRDVFEYLYGRFSAQERS